MWAMAGSYEDVILSVTDGLGYPDGGRATIRGW
jgi:hypothetical protein